MKPNKGKGPVAVAAKVADKANLAKAAKRVNAANTPHRSQSPPSLSLVVYADLDKQSVKKAKKALSKLEGIDVKNSKAQVKKDYLDLRLSGEGEITAASIVKALQDAGIDARLESKG